MEFNVLSGLGPHRLLNARETHNALQSIQELSNSIYIPRGINTDALDRKIQWDFSPTTFKVGETQRIRTSAHSVLRLGR